MIKMVIFISGRGSNMEALIRATQEGILKGIAEAVLVFSNQPEATGLQLAQAHGVATLSLDAKGLKRAAYDQKVVALLQAYEFDYLILAGYMRILSSEFIRSFPNKIINIHPADTNLHQGLHAYDWAFQNQMQTTQITVHYVNEGVDTGQIIAQTTVDLSGAQTLDEVEQRGLAIEHQFYAKTLKELFLNNN
jgi:phosphoribosylglycinamide formyltransferase 1